MNKDPDGNQAKDFRKEVERAKYIPTLTRLAMVKLPCMSEKQEI